MASGATGDVVDRGASAESAGARSGQIERQSPRHIVDGVRCGLGRVVDISDHGMKLVAPWPWRHGSVRLVTIRAGKDKAKVKARCVWLRREGLLAWACGVQFDDHNRWRVKSAVELAMRHKARGVGL